jgi:hypothetical protein
MFEALNPRIGCRRKALVGEERDLYAALKIKYGS